MVFMAEAFRWALVRMLAGLDQVDANVEEIHSACIGTTLEGHADTMRESTWEMRGAVEAELKNHNHPPEGGGSPGENGT